MSGPEHHTNNAMAQSQGFASVLRGRIGTHRRQQVKGRGLTGQVGPSASPWCTSATHSGRDHGARAGQGPAPCFDAVRTCVAHWIEAGFKVPSWRVLTESTVAVRVDIPQPSEPKFEQTATRCIHLLEVARRRALARVVQLRASRDAVPERTLSVSHVHGGTTGMRRVSAPQFAFSLNLAHLTMLPPTQIFWPSSSRCSVGSWAGEVWHCTTNGPHPSLTLVFEKCVAGAVHPCTRDNAAFCSST